MLVRMTKPRTPVVVTAADAPARVRPSSYPEPFASRMRGRSKQPLGDLFGLKNFGVNRTTLAPGSVSALRHAHSLQDEFVYVLEGTPTLVTDEGDMLLGPGMCAGFKAGTGVGHQLANRSDADAVILEIGDRSPGDRVIYPADDLQAELRDAQWTFLRKNGMPY